MKCPLRSFRGKGTYDQDQSEDLDCLKEECAWWQKDLENCIIYQAGMEIGTLCLFLEDIKDKMPKEFQFGK